MMGFQKLPIKRISMVLTLLMTLSMFTACKSKKKSTNDNSDEVIDLLEQEDFTTYTFQDRPFELTPSEDIQLEKYTCPADNMFGLKEIIIYKDTVVAVFDKDRFDEPALHTFSNSRDLDKGMFYGVDLSNILQYPAWGGFAMTVSGDERICVMKYSYAGYEDHIKDPSQPVTCTGISILGRNITFCDGNLKLQYYAEGIFDAMESHEQTFDKETGTWGTEEVDFWSEWIE